MLAMNTQTECASQKVGDSPDFCHAISNIWQILLAVQNGFVLLIEQMKRKQGVKEQLKAENPFYWVGRMNNIVTGTRNR